VPSRNSAQIPPGKRRSRIVAHGLRIGIVILQTGLVDIDPPGRLLKQRRM